MYSSQHLKAAARQRLAGGQDELDLGLAGTGRSGSGGGPLPITSSRTGHLWDSLSRACDKLGSGQAVGGNEVFQQFVLARIIEPTSKPDSLRVLGEAGLSPPSYATVKRRLPVYAKVSWRQQLAAVNAVAPGPTATDMFLEGKDEELLTRLANAVPLERLGTPGDIALVVAFLASPAGHWINGQTIRVNGGII